MHILNFVLSWFHGLALLCLLSGITVGQPSLTDFEIRGCPETHPIGTASHPNSDQILFGALSYPPVWRKDTLHLAMELRGVNCAMGTTYGVRMRKDTIYLGTGLQYNFITKADGSIDSTEFEMEIALCRCDLQFNYSITGLSPDSNYYVAYEILVPEKTAVGPVFQTTNKQELSIFYSDEVTIEQQVLNHIENGKSAYSIMVAHTESMLNSKEVTEEDKEEYVRLFKETMTTRRALNDPYLNAQIDQLQLASMRKAYLNEIKAEKETIKKNVIALRERGVRLKYRFK